MQACYRDFLIRSWEPRDRPVAAAVIHAVLVEYGLPWEPEGADWDVLNVETYYQHTGGEFWVVEHQGKLVGTAAYHPIQRGTDAVEIRKMYLCPEVRGQGLGRFLLQQLEHQIRDRGFAQIWIETDTLLVEAVKLYETNGYQQTTGVETQRCDRVYVKFLNPK